MEGRARRNPTFPDTGERLTESVRRRSMPMGQESFEISLTPTSPQREEGGAEVESIVRTHDRSAGGRVEGAVFNRSCRTITGPI